MGAGNRNLVRAIVRSRNLARVLVGVLAIVIVAASVAPRDAYVQSDTTEDIVRHAVVYGAIAFLTVHLFLQSAFGVGASFMTGVFLVVCFGTGLELVQSWMPLRTISATDQLANVGGALAGGIARGILGLLERRHRGVGDGESVETGDETGGAAGAGGAAVDGSAGDGPGEPAAARTP
jgi:VanZ family protein